MICPNCKQEVLEDTIICPYCKVLIIEEHKGNDVDEVFTCPVCGAENEPGERKCKYCCSLF